MKSGGWCCWSIILNGSGSTRGQIGGENVTTTYCGTEEQEKAMGQGREKVHLCIKDLRSRVCQVPLPGVYAATPLARGQGVAIEKTWAYQVYIWGTLLPGLATAKVSRHPVYQPEMCLPPPPNPLNDELIPINSARTISPVTTAGDNCRHQL